MNNARGLNAMKEKAESLGYSVVIKEQALQGEAREVGESLSQESIPAKSLYLYGGETTVTVKEKGIGGRNQEAALGALPHIPNDSIFVAIATDGRDNSEVAGAFADSELRLQAKYLNLDSQEFLSHNNSYHFFETLHAHIKTGITGANVSDFYFILRK